MKASSGVRGYSRLNKSSLRGRGFKSLRAHQKAPISSNGSDLFRGHIWHRKNPTTAVCVRFCVHSRRLETATAIGPIAASGLRCPPMRRIMVIRRPTLKPTHAYACALDGAFTMSCPSPPPPRRPCVAPNRRRSGGLAMHAVCHNDRADAATTAGEPAVPMLSPKWRHLSMIAKFCTTAQRQLLAASSGVA